MVGREYVLEMKLIHEKLGDPSLARVQKYDFHFLEPKPDLTNRAEMFVHGIQALNNYIGKGNSCPETITVILHEGGIATKIKK